MINNVKASSLLITAEELVSMLGNPKLLLVDTRPFSKYLLGHIPGAINLDLFQFNWIDTSGTGIKEFERQSRILLSNIGVKNNKDVVFYDEISGMSSSRGVWLLLYFSHKNSFLLDGGLRRWKRGEYPIEIKTNPPLRSKFLGKPDRNILASFNEVKKSLGKKHYVILDARTKEEFGGKHVRAAKAGHIPSAINVDWAQNIKNGSLKNGKGLSKLYSMIPRNSKIITYCQGGYRAANTFIALKMLGYENVKMYLGSWGEWGNKVDSPVEQ